MALTYKTIEIDDPDNEGEKIKVILTNTEGNPIAIESADSSEKALDAIHLYTQVPKLRDGEKKFRKGKEEVEKQLKDMETASEELKKQLEAFGDLAPDDALKAIETLKNIDDKKLLEAGEVDKIKESVREEGEKKLEGLRASMQKVVDELKEKEGTYSQTIEGLNREIDDTSLMNEFSNSIWFGGKEPKTILAPEVAVSFFKKYFKRELDGEEKVWRGYFDEGHTTPIFDNEKGTYADFEGSIGQLIDSNEKLRISILQKSSGGGAGGGGGGANEGNIITPDQLGANIDKVISGEVTVKQPTV